MVEYGWNMVSMVKCGKIWIEYEWNTIRISMEYGWWNNLKDFIGFGKGWDMNNWKNEVMLGKRKVRWQRPQEKKSDSRAFATRAKKWDY